MHLNTNVDLQDHSFCELSYNEEEGWLQAVWRGYVDYSEAQWGTKAYLEHMSRRASAFLLNDNSGWRGPWFESLDWLVDVWVPQARKLGLCYVAHVVQADQHHDVLTNRLHGTAPFELQIFQDLADACAWLRKIFQTHSAEV